MQPARACRAAAPGSVPARSGHGRLGRHRSGTAATHATPHQAGDRQRSRRLCHEPGTRTGLPSRTPRRSARHRSTFAAHLEARIVKSASCVRLAAASCERRPPRGPRVPYHFRAVPAEARVTAEYGPQRRSSDLTMRGCSCRTTTGEYGRSRHRRARQGGAGHAASQPEGSRQGGGPCRRIMLISTAAST